MTDIRNTIAKEKYLNKRFQMKSGEWLTIISYINAYNITVKFDDGTIRNKISSGNLNDKLVKNPNTLKIEKIPNSFDKNLLNIGYMGNGTYNSNSPYYIIWKSMFQRCYNLEYMKKYPNYINCIVDEKWHNFQTFAEWCNINYIDKFQLDKGIIIKENKIYSEKTCCFIPQEINKLFTKHNIKRGEYPIGVSYHKGVKKFISCLNVSGKNKHLGYFNTPEEAFQVYKVAKERYIKWMALTWKNKINEKVFNALMNYQVEITD
jgi:hypothetical protein